MQNLQKKANFIGQTAKKYPRIDIFDWPIFWNRSKMENLIGQYADENAYVLLVECNRSSISMILGWENVVFTP